MEKFFSRWFRLAVVNLLLVAIAGVLMRYKILFSLPFVHQKNLLHAHSHFAFSGWISLALCVSLLYVLNLHLTVNLKKYTRLLILSQVASFGMLFTFPFTGYGFLSIFFSTLYIVFSYLFSYRFYRDTQRSSLPIQVRRWFNTGLLWWCISSLGAFGLAFMMANKITGQYLQIGSIYWFLHFQYNGWFIYGVIGLFLYRFAKSTNNSSILFQLLTWSMLPAYFLSTLWMEVPEWVKTVAIVGAIAQVGAIGYLWKLLPRLRDISIHREVRILVFISIGFLLMKFVFQGMSAIPFFSQYAFGLRPIVIGFLHLVFLGCVSLFLFAFSWQDNLLAGTEWIKKGLIIFTSGVILNEIVLFIQGLDAMFMISNPYFQHALFGISILLLTGVILILKGSRRTT